jgi:hypothetical protein
LPLGHGIRTAKRLIIVLKIVHELQYDYKNRASPSLIIALKTVHELQFDYKNRGQ